MRFEPLGLVPAPYPDELLYSVLARMWHYAGRPAISAWKLLLFGSIDRMSHDMPNGIDLVSRRLGHRPGFEPDAIVDRMTLFNYYANYVPPKLADAARESMLQGGTPGPQVLLGVTGTLVRPVERLRFCPDCMADWRLKEEDARWVRLFQLPSTLVCPYHGTVLRASTVSTVQSARYVLEVADERTCPADAEPVLSDVDDFMMIRLRALAEDGVRLLAGPPDRLERAEWKLRYRGWLDRIDLMPRGATYRSELLDGLSRHWGRCHEIWGKASLIEPRGRRGASRPWPLRLLQSVQHSYPPLQHMLLSDYLVAQYVAKLRPRPDFGDGPWPCQNMVADHRGQSCVTQIMPQGLSRGRPRATFHCSCGHVYSRVLREDGTLTKARTVAWGHVTERFVREALAAGRGLEATARAIGAASDRVHAIAVGAGPKQQTSILPPAVRNRRKRSRSLLVTVDQGAGKRSPGRGRRPDEWAARDELLAAQLPVIIADLHRMEPPARITGTLIAKRIEGSATALRSQLDRLPTFAALMLKAIETRTQWEERRRDWAVATLLSGAAWMTPRARRTLRNKPGVADALRRLDGAPTATRHQKEFSTVSQVSPRGASEERLDADPGI